MNANIEQTLEGGKNAFLAMACLSTSEKNIALERLASLIEANQSALLAANAQDLAENKDALEPALYQRLKLDSGKLSQVVQGIRQLVSLADPAGQVLAETELDDGLILSKRAVDWHYF
jgi:glutamate-5-semialdehyde dehydrogenase